MAGIKTVAVDYRPMARQTKTVGYVTYDESGLSRIVSRVDGYVEKLYVDKSYAMVHKGDPLAEIYSPELYSTARELVLSAKGQGIDGIAASARNKLLLLGVSAEDIDRMLASGEPSPRMMIRSPQTGHVVDKKIVVGASVEAKMTLFEVADLSTVWIEAEVFENDIPFLQAGQEVEATVEAYPNRTFTGKLTLVHPHLETATRTNRVRFKLDNPDHELRPGMFATVTIDTPLETIEPYKTLAAKTARVILTGLNAADEPPASEFLVVPEQAVVDTGCEEGGLCRAGTRDCSRVSKSSLGPRQDDFYPVLKGLAAGDKVAAAGGFLIDAETRLNPAAASTYFGASGGPHPVDIPACRRPPAHGADEARPDRSNGAAGRPVQPDGRSSDVAALTAEDIKNIEQLPEEDRQPAKAQAICPVTGTPLGSMGVPVKITLRGKPVFLCCQGCVGKAKQDPDGTLKKLAELQALGSQLLAGKGPLILIERSSSSRFATVSSSSW